MKKWVLCLMAILAIGTQAADFTYKYLVVKVSDGTQTALDAEGLQLTFADGQLVATNGTGSQSFALAQLASMTFSETDGTTTGIDPTAAIGTAGGRVEVYTLSGRLVGTFDSASTLDTQLRSGVYVVKQNKKSTKIIIK